jgi:cytochrome P450
MVTSTTPVRSPIDLWSDAVLLNPFPVYRELRDLAPVVHLERYDLYAITRYADVKQVLRDWETFSSAQGVGFNEPINQIIAGSLVGSDPPRHRHYRGILERPLAAEELKAVRERVAALVAERLDALAGRPSVEVVSELASYVPVELVADLVGLPAEGRERMLDWAAGAFDSLAPLGVPRVEEGMARMASMRAYFEDPTLPARLRPGSWAARLQGAVERGEIGPDEFTTLLSVNYVLPALDTTIHGMTNMLWLLAQTPELWNRLRANPALVVRTVHEALRLEGPVQSFSRVAARDTEIDGCAIRAGDRVLVSFGSANRDERHYPNPDTIDLSRGVGDHVAFGFAEHICLGRGLAIVEMTALLAALVARVERIEILEATRGFNNGLRGFARLQVALH